MKISTENVGVWQFAAGDSNRSYQDLCLRWDAIMFGPGYAGRWPECRLQLEKDGWSKRKIGLIQKFAEEVKDGDIIVLRIGTSEVYGVGQIVGDYLWDDDFGDIDGWDLQHVRRVRWLWKCEKNPKTFGAFGLKFGDTIQKLTSLPVLAWIESLEIPNEQSNMSLVPLPSSSEGGPAPDFRIAISAIADSLFDAGVAARSIDALADGIDDLRRIASWYDRADVTPSESETVAYLVVPLLRAIGWTPQRMAVEWNFVDLALFERMPREDSNLAVAVEVKKRGRSCLNARSQAEGYAEEKGRERCLRLIVTDGVRYGVYVREPGKAFDEGPTAYLNLTRMMSFYRILECEGADEALKLMSADWAPLSDNTFGHQDGQIIA